MKVVIMQPYFFSNIGYFQLSLSNIDIIDVMTPILLKRYLRIIRYSINRRFAEWKLAKWIRTT
jgi:hypothetical protein